MTDKPNSVLGSDDKTTDDSTKTGSGQAPSPESSVPQPTARFAAMGGGLRPDVRILGLLGVLLLLCVVGYLTSDGLFLTEGNISTVLRLSAAIGVVSIGMTFVIATGGIDLSVGSMVALSSVWMTTVATQSFGFGMMVVCGLVVGLAAGLINGILVSYGKVVPFIATLAMMASARGLAERISGRQTQVVTEQDFLSFFRGDFLGIPVLIWIFAVVFAVGWVLLNRTTFGRRTLAVGGNPEASRLAGINVKRHLAMVYGLAGLCCGIAAIMVVARTTSGAASNGLLYELDAIAAVVIGGTLLSGGRASMFGTLIGVLIFTVLGNIFTLNNLETDIQNIAKGVIIVIAVLLQYRTLNTNRTT
ncbi:permease component of ribose/xylose/arabinose/galactoside ABC-type transporters [Actinoalloteichus sp. GBA129-24]|uniref:Permease component of ribose/xylose/arabinose/galactoside ABC-type transporters n=2 Tax=Pseudonocardiaceae TaxID=2070 RepID=A0AAC9PUP4_9PSEU|nr:permease component of ribose/xylose/arabinose/galactoside ABC-type transporters [Actinoalloteichus fjordicus]APU23509.1 permease component of ribose/xylose/arabinose/galactoside ABC-type transporters [Actinoalloteichus sp. GBA129-24]